MGSEADTANDATASRDKIRVAMDMDEIEKHLRLPLATRDSKCCCMGDVSACPGKGRA